jgi:uncharacterized RDD family membrane protein YckC
VTAADRALVTPEGVALRLRIGSAGERFGAFVIDVIIIWGLLLALSLAALAGSFAGVSALGLPAFQGGMVVWLVGAFLLRNFYFAGFELRPRAATPGKRVMGLRVVARDGGRLSADAIFARNAMREIELFLPVSTMLSMGLDGGWLTLLGAGWTGVFLLFPLFNRDRLRIGDLVAGTLVVHARRRKLQAELVGAGEVGAPEIDFTPEQLDAYGVKELQVLEAVLRNNDRATLATVARRIQAKIGWTGGLVPDRAFLTAYYAGLRGRLEGRLLFGHRRRDKHDRG